MSETTTGPIIESGSLTINVRVCSNPLAHGPGGQWCETDTEIVGPLAPTPSRPTILVSTTRSMRRWASFACDHHLRDLPTGGQTEGTITTSLDRERLVKFYTVDDLPPRIPTGSRLEYDQGEFLTVARDWTISRRRTNLHLYSDRDSTWGTLPEGTMVLADRQLVLIVLGGRWWRLTSPLLEGGYQCLLPIRVFYGTPLKIIGRARIILACSTGAHAITLETPAESMGPAGHPGVIFGGDVPALDPEENQPWEDDTDDDELGEEEPEPDED